MGALTSRINSYAFRSWEQRPFILDDRSDLNRKTMRRDRLKMQIVRYLPIKYWMANEMRFRKESITSNNTSLLFYSFKILLCLSQIFNETISLLHNDRFIRSFADLINKLFSKIKMKMHLYLL